MGDVLMTGFPGFLGSALLPRILERRPQAHAYCLVQPHYHALATDALIVFPWDRKIVEDGDMVVHPTYRGAIED